MVTCWISCRRTVCSEEIFLQYSSRNMNQFIQKFLALWLLTVNVGLICLFANHILNDYVGKNIVAVMGFTVDKNI